MENHNFAQAAKRQADFLGDLPGFNFADHGVGGDGLGPQFFNLSPNYLNPPAGLENKFLESPWPRGAAATTPQDHVNLHLGMQSTAALLDSAASPEHWGIARNLDPLPDPFLPHGAATSPKRKLPAFPQIGPPSRASVGTQTSPGLECNAHFFGKVKPAAKGTQPLAAVPGNNNINRIKSRNVFSLQGASLPPLPKRKKLDPAVAVTSRPSSQQPNSAMAVHEITGTSLPSNAQIPSRGAKALTLAKSQPYLNDVNIKKKRRPGRPPRKQTGKKTLPAPGATTTSANPSSFLDDNNNMTHLDPTAPLSFSLNVSRPSTMVKVLPPAAKTALPSSRCITSTTTSSAYDLLMCEVCGLGEPDESIIICDGCDLGYHLECLRPALTQVPTGAWFCDCCCNKLAATIHPHRFKQPCQHLAAGGSHDASVEAISLFSPAHHTTAKWQQQPVFGPMNKNTSRHVAMFNSTDPPVRPSYSDQAKLQVLIFLAEHGDSTTASMRLHYDNKRISKAVGRLFAAGIIHKAQSSTRECVYALDSALRPTVEQWKERLHAYTRVLQEEEEWGKEEEEEEEEEDVEEELEAPIARNSIPLSAAATASITDGTSRSRSKYGISSRLFFRLCSTESFPLSDIRQAQLQTLVLLSQHGPSTTAEIRGYFGDIEPFPQYTMGSLARSGIVMYSKENGLKNRYAINPDIIPHIDAFQRKLKHHKTASTPAAAAASQPVVASPSLSNRPSTNSGHTQHHQKPLQPQPCASDLPSNVRSSLFYILCFDNDEEDRVSGEDKEIPRPLSLTRHSQLQALIHFVNHGPASADSLQEIYGNQVSRGVFRTGLLEMYKAGMVHRERVKKQHRVTEYMYTLAPTMQQYFPIWKKKLENDGSKGMILHLKKKKNKKGNAR